jgi:hypothetical protein
MDSVDTFLKANYSLGRQEKVPFKHTANRSGLTQPDTGWFVLIHKVNMIPTAVSPRAT